ncbi:2OG-Fe(II) oxygenase [Tepidamorphus sp. 3E244]|uniref:2OG-Fe(II) oxygenase n=1 Tax=Tepidamorphus sp. 3E244 TaxID=3385498 RepID=UPI0038FD241E
MDERIVDVRVDLLGGVSRSCQLPAESEILEALHAALATSGPGMPARLVQLPLDGGTTAFSFMSDRLVSVTTTPPVLIEQELMQPAVTGAGPGRVSHVVIDDFLTPAENRALLQFAVSEEPNFTKSSVILKEGDMADETYRKSRVHFGIRETGWFDTFANRLKLHLPHLMKTLAVDQMRFEDAELQLTASNDGDFFKQHSDSDHNHERAGTRALTFVYYLHREPCPFTGGDLLFFDHGDVNAAGVTAVPPRNNSLVAFPSEHFHEVDLVRCPSRAFGDSRFTVNGWLRRA